jgi:hypothetical protein
MFRNWLKFAWDANLLALEAQQVMAMRVMKISLGGRRGSEEAERMLSEKILAAGQAGMRLARGGSGHSVVKQYRRKVRANRKRLAK